MILPSSRHSNPRSLDRRLAAGYSICPITGCLCPKGWRPFAFPGRPNHIPHLRTSLETPGPAGFWCNRVNSERDDVGRTHMPEAARAWPFEEARKLVALRMPRRKRLCAVRDRLWPFGPAAYRNLRRGGADHHGAPGLPAPERHSDAPLRLFPTTWTASGRCRPMSPTRRCWEVSGHAPPRCPTLRQVRELRHHNNAMLRGFLDGFGFQYEFQSSTDWYTSGRFDEALLNSPQLRRHSGDHAEEPPRGARSPIRPSCRFRRRPEGC